MKIRNLFCFHEYITLINGSIKFQISYRLEKVQKDVPNAMKNRFSNFNFPIYISKYIVQHKDKMQG